MDDSGWPAVEAAMTKDQYWDLNECRWVRYVAPGGESGPNDAHAPLPRPRQQAEDLATQSTAAAVEGR